MCQWNPIQTIPKDTLVDLWIKSSNNEDYGRRLCNVSLTIQGRFTGDNLPVEEFGEYASHWMPSPKGPL